MPSEPSGPRWTCSTTGGRRAEAEQYRAHLAADRGALPVLHTAGLAVLSEKKGVGVHGRRHAGLLACESTRSTASTNAHRGVPFYSTSICVLDAEGPLRVSWSTRPRHPLRRHPWWRCGG